jgi:preprotein translocase subunit SecG
MFNEIFILVKSWDVPYQLTVVLITAFFLTLIVLGVVKMVDDFLNDTLPTLLRGYKPASKDDEKEP